MSSKSGYQFFDPKQGKFRQGDLIMIPFGKLPSLYRVLSARGPKLLVVVIEDNYEKNPVPRGTICDLGSAIYEGYWCHRRIREVKPKKGKVHYEKP